MLLLTFFIGESEVEGFPLNAVLLQERLFSVKTE